MDLIINDATKNQILELINKFPGAFHNYDEISISKLKKNIASKEICITALENVMYNCQCMRSTIKSYTIYDSSFALAENIYLSMPKHSDYNEDSGIFYKDIPALKSMSNETLLSTLTRAFQAQKIYANVMKHQNFTSRAERILQSIESLQNQTINLSELEKSQLESIYVDIKKQLNNVQNIDLQALNNDITLFNDVAISIWNKYLDDGRCFLVHNYSRGHIENFIPSKYLSTSLMSDKFMALFQENYNNNYGFIVKPKKIVSADSKDTFTHNRSENTGIDMYSSGHVPPILFPWEIEEEAIKKTVNINGEILNYDNGYVLPEIVLEDYDLISVYYRTNGEGKLSPSYESAKELAKSNGLELIEIDMSLARMNIGLQPMTIQMQKKFFLNIIRKYYMGENNAKLYFGRRSFFDKFEDQKIILKYLNDLYDAYINLRKSEKLNEETLLNAIFSTISPDDLLIIKNYYDKCIETHQYLFTGATNKLSENTIEKYPIQSQLDKSSSQQEKSGSQFDKLPKIQKNQEEHIIYYNEVQEPQTSPETQELVNQKLTVLKSAKDFLGKMINKSKNTNKGGLNR